MDQDGSLTLHDVVDQAQWMHNTNLSSKGSVPLQLMTGKAVVFPVLERTKQDGVESD